MLGEQRLVGGDDGLAGRERRLDRRERHPVLAADELDEKIDLARLRQSDRVVEPGEAGDVDAAVLALLAGRNPGDDDFAADAASERRRLPVEQAR